MRVLDQSDAVVPGAGISVVNTSTGAERQATSGSDGSATIAALPLTGAYRVSVRKPGFSDKEIDAIRLQAGETARLRVTLVVAGGASQMTVYGTAEGLRQDPEIGVRLDTGQIDTIPVLGRKLTTLPMLNAAFRNAKGTGDLFLNNTLFVANAGGRRQTTYTVDGATGDDPWGRQTLFSGLPLGAVQEITALSEAFSAEFGWTSSAAVNLVTKSGTNAWHSDLLYLGRPARFEATMASLGGATTVVTPDVPDVLQQYSGALGGPVVKDRTFFFVAGEYTRQNRTAYFSSAVPSTLLPQASFVGRYRQALADLRVDHTLGPANHLMVRVNLDRFSDDNPQDTVSNTTLPGAARVFARHTYSVQGNLTSMLGHTALNEARLEWQDGDPITEFEPVTPSTQFVRTGVATEGESRVAFIRSRQTQASDTLSLATGRHYLKIGGSVARATSGGNGQEFGSGFLLGQFIVRPGVIAPLSQLTIDDMSRYTQSFGTSTYESSQWLGAAFVQDRIRLRSDFSLDAGLRYDRQTFSDGTRNFAPRVGFAWSPNASPSTVVRGGYGLYYSQLPQTLQANFSLNGPTGVFTYAASPGQPGFPASLSEVPIAFPASAVLPPRDITIRPGLASYYAQFFDIAKLTRYPGTLVNPRSGVGSVGLERRIGGTWLLSADFVTQHWVGITRPADLNAPALFPRTAPGQVRAAAEADASRPIVPVPGGYRRIIAIVNDGVADYNGLQVTVNGRVGTRATVSASYTLSKSTNTVEPDGSSQDPNDANQLGAGYEEGPSQLDQRHRAVVGGVFRLPAAVMIGGVAQIASARPFTALTGVDNNGDGSISDRPVIDGTVVGRNTFRGTATFDVDVFAERATNLAHARTISIRVEVFNLFDHANILGRNTTYGNGAAPLASFASPATGLANLDPARQVQLQGRFSF